MKIDINISAFFKLFKFLSLEFFIFKLVTKVKESSNSDNESTTSYESETDFNDIHLTFILKEKYFIKTKNLFNNKFILEN